MAILNRFSAILLYCDSTHYFASRCGISGDSGPAILGIVRFAIRDSVPLRSFGLYSQMKVCGIRIYPQKFTLTPPKSWEDKLFGIAVLAPKRVYTLARQDYIHKFLFSELTSSKKLLPGGLFLGGN